MKYFRHLRLTYSNSKDNFTDDITVNRENTTLEDNKKYFLNKCFNFGVEEDNVYTCIKIEEIN